MYTVVCPQCQHEMKLKQVKVGKFTPKCSECEKRFILQVSEGPGKKFQVRVGTPKQKKQSADETKIDKGTGDASKTIAEADLNQTAADIAGATRVNDDDVSSQEPAKPKSKSAGPPVDDNDATRTDLSSDPVTNAEKDTTRVESFETAIPKSMPNQLGGYRLIEQIGRGGMGSVFRARQMSLDREVALKVIRRKLAEDPASIARFTREAYAAAQLVHHNVVQIYDMGDEDGNCFFSMELVRGPSLDKVVKQHNKLDPEQAASYILQAARGLQVAHGSGMVHRDIKPANLLVNSQGVVKVADLGLVKVPDAEEIEANEEFDRASALSASQDLTQVGTGVGTVNYMAPEQAKNAASVDHRADIYSLGCTFYVLLTGRPPFKGDSIKEVVSKHFHEELVQPDKIVERVPAELSSIVTKMMAKKPDGRYEHLGLVITELENFLGVVSAGKFTPEDKDSNTLTACVKRYHDSPLIKIRDFVMPAILLVCAVLTVVLTMVDLRWASLFVVLPAVTFVTYFVARGLSLKTHLFDKVRELVARSRIIDWLIWIAGLLLLIAGSFFLGTYLHWFLALLFGVGIGLGVYFGIDAAIHKHRLGCLASAKQLILKLREKGTDERTVQTFFAKYSGVNWEELFENLFGYPAKRKMRDTLAARSGDKKRTRKFRPWRDRLIDRVNSRLNQMDSEKEKSHLQKVEQAGLVAQGVSEVDARAQAAEMATSLVEQAANQKIRALQEKIAKFDPAQARENKRTRVKEMLADARSGKYRREKSTMEQLTPKLNLFMGGRVRFLVGALLLTGFFMWVKQNGIISFDQIRKSVAEASETKDADKLSEGLAESFNQNKETEPLNVPIVGGMFNSFGPGAAGLILVLSIGVPGWRMSLFAIPAVIVILLGPAMGIPGIEAIGGPATTCMIIGAIIAGAGVLLGQTDD